MTLFAVVYYDYRPDKYTISIHSSKEAALDCLIDLAEDKLLMFDGQELEFAKSYVRSQEYFHYAHEKYAIQIQMIEMIDNEFTLSDDDLKGNDTLEEIIDLLNEKNE